LAEAIAVHRSFPARLMHASAKCDAVAYLAASDLTPAIRRKLWRAWCKATFSSCRSEDLARVAPGKPREVQPLLITGAFDGVERVKRRPARKSAKGRP
jgi:hypothetical protein